MTFDEVMSEYGRAPIAEYPNGVVKDIPEPLVSVAIGAYQHGPFIRRCLESILAQETAFSFEVCVGEDASNDGTRETCIAVARAHSGKIRLFLHDRRNVIMVAGRPSAKFQFLHTLHQTRGRYVAVCDGDDYWIDPRKLAKQVEKLEGDRTASLCFSNYRVVDDQENVIQEVGLEPDRRRDLTHELVLSSQTPHPSTTVYRRESLPADFPGQYFGSPHGDLFLAALATRSGRALFLPDVTTCYRQHSGGMYSSKSETGRMESLLEAVLRMKEVFRSPEERTAMRDRIAALSASLVKAYLVEAKYAAVARLTARLAKADIGLPLWSAVNFIRSAVRED